MTRFAHFWIFANMRMRQTDYNAATTANQKLKLFTNRELYRGRCFSARKRKNVCHTCPREPRTSTINADSLQRVADEQKQFKVI